MTIKDERYTLLEMLGRGGEGEVWRAADSNLADGVFIALKFLPPEIQHLESQRERLRACFQQFVGLAHDGICQIRHLDKDDKQGMFLIMPYIEGANLDGYRQILLESLRQNPETLGDEELSAVRHGLIPLARVVALLRPVAAGLDYLHDSGTGPALIHRDVKPSNIRVSADGQICKLIDHGIAAAIQVELTRTQAMQTPRAAGTPLYMAPEAFRNCQLDSRSDQYSFAVVVYQFISDMFPFEPISWESYKHCLLHEPPRRIRGLNNWAMSVLETALLKEPSQRYRNCQEFLDELERAADGVLRDSVAEKYVEQWNKVQSTHYRDKFLLFMKDIRRGIVSELITTKLNRYLSIEPEAAKRLVVQNLPRRLDLSGLESIDTASASELARFKGLVNLSGLSTLSDDVAQAFVGDGERLQNNRTTLVLDGIADLDATVAACLAQWLSVSGNTLQLGGLHELSSDVALALVATQGTLVLNGIEQLSGATAEALSSFCGILQLPRLINPSLESIEVLASCAGWQPGSLTMISAQVAKSLVSAKSKLSGNDPKSGGINLSRLRELTADAACELAKFAGTLNLTGLESASSAVITELWVHPGHLRLGSIDQWSASSRKRILQRRDIEILSGKFRYDDLSPNDLSHIASMSEHLNELTDSYCVAFLRHIDQLESRNSFDEFADETSLTPENGCLNFPFLCSLTLRDASCLVSLGERIVSLKGHCDLFLNGLGVIEERSAMELAAFDWRILMLNGLTMLDESAAKELASFSGEYLFLDGLAALDRPTTAALAAYTGNLTLGVSRLSDGEAEAIAMYQGKSVLFSRLLDASDHAIDLIARNNKIDCHGSQCSKLNERFKAARRSHEYK